MFSCVIRKRYKMALSFLFTAFIATASAAEPVQQLYNGLQLNAKTNVDIASLAERRVFLIVHGTLAHNSMEIIDSLLSVLKEENEAALALTLSLNIDDRKGMFPCNLKHTHRHEDAGAEIALWLDWLSAQGATSVVLVGHSRGSIQVAEYLTSNQDKRVTQAVLIAPPTARKGSPQEISVDAQTGDIKLEKFLHCENATVTASSYASYYGEHPTDSTLKTIAALSLPVKIFVGSKDDVVEAKGWESVTSSLPENVQISVISGADHYFRDLYAYDIVENILDWAE
jgi:alpha/beta superfamily hydrolase